MRESAIGAAEPNTSSSGTTRLTTLPLALGARYGIDDGLQRGFRPIVGIEDEREPRPAPRAAIAEPPERHAIDRRAVLHEDGEQPGVGVCLRAQEFRGRRLRGGLAATELSAARSSHRHVKFGDGNSQFQRPVVLDGPLDLLVLLRRQRLQAPVSLNADASDWRTLGDQTLQQLQRALVLCATLDAVVVVEERR